MKFLAILLLAMFLSPAWAQRPGPDPTYPQKQWNQQDRVPRWCRDYDRRDYWRERRACGDDRYCLRQVRRKAERCGLR